MFIPTFFCLYQCKDYCHNTTAFSNDNDDDIHDDDNNINITGKHEVKELQKTAILGTAHILRNVLM